MNDIFIQNKIDTFLKENLQYITKKEMEEKRPDILEFYQNTHKLLKETKSKSKKVKELQLKMQEINSYIESVQINYGRSFQGLEEGLRICLVKRDVLNVVI